MNITQWLNKYFTESGALQSEIADSAGITRDLMSRYISGSRVPAVPNMVKLAIVLDLDLNELKNLEEFEELKEKCL